MNAQNTTFSASTVTIRTYLLAGVSLVGAGIVAAAPITPPPAAPVQSVVAPLALTALSSPAT